MTAEVNKSALTAFAPGSPYMAAGVSSLSDRTNLDIFEVDMILEKPQITLAGSVTCSNAFSCISWGKESIDSEEYSMGIIAGLMRDQRILLWNPNGLIWGSVRSAIFIQMWIPQNLVGCLEFNPHSPNLLASGASEGAIYIWDICGSLCKPHLLTAAESETQGNVSSLSWNKINPDILASTSYNGVMSIWDTRDKTQATSLSDGFLRHGSVIRWHPSLVHEFVVGSYEHSSPSLKVWDIRKMDDPVNEFWGHTKGVIAMSWCPHDHSYLITCSENDSMIYWDAINGKILTHLENDRCLDVNWHPSIPDIISASSPGKFGVYKILFNECEVVDLQEERIITTGRHDIFSELSLPFDRTAIHGGVIGRPSAFYQKKAESMLSKYELARGKGVRTDTAHPEAATSPIEARSPRLRREHDSQSTNASSASDTQPSSSSGSISVDDSHDDA